MKTKKDNRPPKHERTRKRGDVREDGMVFWAYAASATGGEHWVTADALVASNLRKNERQRLTDRRPPKELRIKRHGDVGPDGQVFWGYNPNAPAGEVWLPVGVFNSRHATLLEGNKRRYDARDKQCPVFRLRRFARFSAFRAVRFASCGKPSRSFELLGTDLETFKTHIESQFVEGMSWDNYGEWHIDHIIPLASGKTPEEIWGLCHYTNLQPLWAADNIRKGAKILEDSA